MHRHAGHRAMVHARHGRIHLRHIMRWRLQLRGLRGHIHAGHRLRVERHGE